jgi:hypothetical protein
VAVTIYIGPNQPLVVPNFYGLAAQAKLQKDYNERHGTVWGKEDPMIDLQVCDKVLDTWCPKWKTEVANGEAEIGFQGKTRWDQVFNKNVDVVPRPLSTAGFQFKRFKGMVREIIITTPAGSWGLSWPYLSRSPGISSVEMVVVVTLEPTHTPIPGNHKGSTAYNINSDIHDILRRNGIYRNISSYVGNAGEVKSWLKALADTII